MIINAENLILGRLSTIVAKKALLGDTIDIVNSEKVVIVGRKEDILERYNIKRSRGGDALKGPYFPRTPDKLIRRAIRGMLPYKQGKGQEAFKRIRCHIGIPEDLKDKKIESIEEAKLSPKKIDYITIKELTKHLGAKQYGS